MYTFFHELSLFYKDVDKKICTPYIYSASFLLPIVNKDLLKQQDENAYKCFAMPLPFSVSVLLM